MSGPLVFCLVLLAAETVKALRLIWEVRSAGRGESVRKSERAPIEVLWM